MVPPLRASASVTIECDVDAVFAYLSDPATMEQWVTGVSDAGLVSGEGGSVGDVYEYRYTYGGRTVPMRVEIAAVERPVRIAIEAVEGPFPFGSELTLAGDGGRTRVTNVIETGADGRVTAALFTLFAPLARGDGAAAPRGPRRTAGDPRIRRHGPVGAAGRSRYARDPVTRRPGPVSITAPAPVGAGGQSNATSCSSLASGSIR